MPLPTEHCCAAKAAPEFLFPGRRLAAADPCWRQKLEHPALTYLRDHCISGQILLPGAVYVEAGLALADAVQAEQRLAGQALALTGLKFRQALVVNPCAAPELRLGYRAESREYTIGSHNPANAELLLHAAGKLALRPTPTARPAPLAAHREQCLQRLDVAAFYRQFHRRGMDYGPSFRGIRRLWKGPAQALAWIETRPGLNTAAHRYYLHPAILDAGFQALAATLETDSSAMFLPVSIKEVRFYASPGPSLWGHVRLTKRGQRGLEGDITLYDPQGNPLTQVLGFRCLVTSPWAERHKAS